MLNTHIKSIFIDHEHSHVLGQQLAWVSCNDKNQTKDETPCFQELIYNNILNALWFNNTPSLKNLAVLPKHMHTHTLSAQKSMIKQIRDTMGCSNTF